MAIHFPLVSKNNLSHARTVLHYAPDLSEPVRFGRTSLDEAYAEARARKEAANSSEAQMARLRTVASRCTNGRGQTVATTAVARSDR